MLNGYPSRPVFSLVYVRLKCAVVALFPGRGKKLHLKTVVTGSATRSAGVRVPFPTVRRQGREAEHLHLVTRLGINRAIIYSQIALLLSR